MIDLDDKLERIAVMLDLAKQIVEELQTGETCDTEADAEAAISEACALAQQLLKVEE